MKLTEHVAWSGQSQIDEDAGIIRDVKILGFVSKNGRRYKPEALQKAKSLYEGAGVNLDHLDQPNGRRRVLDSFGRLTGVHMRDDGLYGNLEYLTSHQYAKPFVESAKRMPEQVGLSHDVFGKVSQDGDEDVVEAIHRVQSVDVVRYPATTKGLFESEDMQKSDFRKSLLSIVEDEDLSDEEVGRQIMTKVEETKDGVDVQDDDKKVKDGATKEDDTRVEQENLAKVREAIEKLTGDVSRLEEKLKKPFTEAIRRIDVLECCMSHRVNVADVPEADMKKLMEQETRDDMDKLVEEWPASVKFTGKPQMGGGEGKSEFDSIREEMGRRYPFVKK